MRFTPYFHDLDQFIDQRPGDCHPHAFPRQMPIAYLVDFSRQVETYFTWAEQFFFAVNDKSSASGHPPEKFKKLPGWYFRLPSVIFLQNEAATAHRAYRKRQDLAPPFQGPVIGWEFIAFRVHGFLFVKLIFFRFEKSFQQSAW
jgi:hypothetical protein